jgi:predicted ATP-grasp superfamily ATP-dependent carboligase
MTKRRYLTISEGYSAVDAQPIIATSDSSVIRAVAREISKRLKVNLGSSKESTHDCARLRELTIDQ